MQNSCASAPPNGSVEHRSKENFYCAELPRIQSLEEGQKELRLMLANLSLTIGTPPGIDGTPGTGMAGTLYRLASKVLTGTSKTPFEVLSDGDEEQEDNAIRAENVALKTQLAAARSALETEAEHDERAMKDKSESRKVFTYIAGAALGGGGLVGLIQAVIELLK